MNMKIVKSDEERLFEKKAKEMLEKERIVGMRIGAKSVSQVIYNKLTDNSKTDTEKIAEVIKFCKVGLKIDGDKDEN